MGSSIWTNNMQWANRAVREIDAGVTWINQIHYGYDELPFGGVKAKRSRRGQIRRRSRLGVRNAG